MTDVEQLEEHGIHLLTRRETERGWEVIRAEITAEIPAGAATILVAYVRTSSPDRTQRRWRLLIVRAADDGRRSVIRLVRATDAESIIRGIEQGLRGGEDGE